MAEVVLDFTVISDEGLDALAATGIGDDWLHGDQPPLARMAQAERDLRLAHRLYAVGCRSSVSLAAFRAEHVATDLSLLRTLATAFALGCSLGWSGDEAGFEGAYDAARDEVAEVLERASGDLGAGVFERVDEVAGPHDADRPDDGAGGLVGRHAGPVGGAQGGDRHGQRLGDGDRLAVDVIAGAKPAFEQRNGHDTS